MQEKVNDKIDSQTGINLWNKDLTEIKQLCDISKKK